MPSNKVQRFDVVVFSIGKEKALVRKVRKMTVNQMFSEVQRLEVSTSVAECNKCGFYTGLQDSGLSLRAIEERAEKSHTHVNNYIHLGHFEWLRIRVAKGDTFTKCRDLAMAMDSKNNSLTEEKAKILVNGTREQWKAGIAECAILTEAQKAKIVQQEEKKALDAANRVATIAAEFDTLTVAELDQLIILAGIARSAKLLATA